jgi:hypothetical protein
MFWRLLERENSLSLPISLDFSSSDSMFLIFSSSNSSLRLLSSFLHSSFSLKTCVRRSEISFSHL